MKSWIKCVIFDLDNVLFDAKTLHFTAFRDSVKEIANVKVDEKWYFSTDGETSLNKLIDLVQQQKILWTHIPEIMELKQEKTLALIRIHAKRDEEKINLFKNLRQFHDVKIGVASNSRSVFVRSILRRLGVSEFIDIVKSGDKVTHPKPNAQIYLKCMEELGVSPFETVIFEDSFVGKKAAIDSGAHLVHVDSVAQVTLDWVTAKILKTEMHARENNRDLDVYGIAQINVVVPMAGMGSRFTQQGYTVPKPFILVKGRPLVRVSIDGSQIPGKYIFCAQKEHVNSHSQTFFSLLNADDDFVIVQKLTEGAACTILLAEKFIDNNQPLFIINSDQYVDWDWSRFMTIAQSSNADGGIVTFEATGNKWSYAKNEPGTNRVIEVAEKQPISTHATAGIYYWRRGSDFVKYAKQMIKKNIRVNNEFYTCPVYNEAIEAGLKIISFPANEMLGLGTPEDLKENVEKL